MLVLKKSVTFLAVHSFAGAVFMGLFVVFFSTIALRFLLTEVNKSRQSEARSNIGIMHRAQGAYWIEFKQFANWLELSELINSSSEVGSLSTQTENYDYSVRTTPLSAFHYAIPRKKGLKGYVGVVYLSPTNDGTGEIWTLADICETKSPSMTRPTEPIVRGNVLECGPNTRSLYKLEEKEDSSSKSSTSAHTGNDLELGINSLNYATAGQYEQALLVAQTIDSRPLQGQVLKEIAIQLAEKGQYNKALQVAESLKYEDNNEVSKAIARYRKLHGGIERHSEREKGRQIQPFPLSR